MIPIALNSRIRHANKLVAVVMIMIKMIIKVIHGNKNECQLGKFAIDE